MARRSSTVRSSRATGPASLAQGRPDWCELVAHAPIGMAVVDHAGRLLAANDSALQHLGHNGDSQPATLACGRTWRTITGPAVPFWKAIGIPIYVGAREKRVIGLIGPNDERRWVSVTTQAFGSQDPPCFVVSIDDVTSIYAATAEREIALRGDVPGGGVAGGGH